MNLRKMQSYGQFVVVLGICAANLFFTMNLCAQQRAPLPPTPQGVPDSDATPVLDDLPTPELTVRFGFPEGLYTPADRLFSKLGLGPAHCFPLTPVTCFETGYLCYSRGLYHDALAFVDHGLKLSNHSRLYLLKAVCEMHDGHCDDAIKALARYRQTSTLNSEAIGIVAARERINDPMRVRLEFLLGAR